MTKLHITRTSIVNVLTFLFCLILMVDPETTVFKITKELFIVLAFASFCTYKKVHIKYLCLPLIVYAVMLITNLLGMLGDRNFDVKFALGMYKTFIYLFLLLWIDRYELFNQITISALVLCSIVFFLLYQYTYHPENTQKLLAYTTNHQNLFSFSTRNFLGREFYSFFYKSIYIIIIPYSIFLFKFLVERKKKMLHLLIMITFGYAFFLSGTRANMVALLFVTVVLIFIKLWRTKSLRLMAVIMCVFGVIATASLALRFLGESSEYSNRIKSAHLKSYKELLLDKPYILITGQGIGAKFYTHGFGFETVNTEWTYLDIVRCFGLIGGGVVITVWFFPLYLLHKKRKILPYSTPMFWAYLSFLLIAGTNPYLFHGPGMLAMLAAYNYVKNKKYELVL